MAQTAYESSGVQELIDRVRDEGVQAGRREAERIVQAARQEAAGLIAEAQAEAEQVRARVAETVATEQAAAREALKLAARDALLGLRAELSGRFRRLTAQLVSTELRDREFLRELILAVAGRALPETDGRSAQVLIADDWFGEAPPREGRYEEDEQPVRELLLGLTGELMREGFELRPAGDDTPGLRVRLEGETFEVDLSDEGIAALLLKHLQPRFRALFDGQYRLRSDD
ncbi:MAG TPA: hypothetical protein VGC20_12105 [bacterium]